MFLKCYLELTEPYAVVREAMGRPDAWLDGLAEETGRGGHDLLVEVGLALAGHRMFQTAQLHAGSLHEADRVASLPVRLRLEGSDRIFPTFEGTLDAAWLGDSRTQLALSLQYDPPLGALGRVADRALMHRVAETVARDFLDRAALRLLRAAAGLPAVPIPQAPAATGPVGGLRDDLAAGTGAQLAC